jgi:hypothetical protein
VLHGGQWTTEGGSGSPSESTNSSDPNGASRPVQYAALDIGTRTDATNAGRTNANSNNNDVVLAGDIVTPHGFTVQQLPSQDPLDPQGLNTPISADEQQKTADALTLIVDGDTSALQPHPYKTFHTISQEPYCRRARWVIPFTMSQSPIATEV